MTREEWALIVGKDYIVHSTRNEMTSRPLWGIGQAAAGKVAKIMYHKSLPDLTPINRGRPIARDMHSNQYLVWRKGRVGKGK